MTTLRDFDIPLNDLESQVMAWVDEALELRHGSAEDPEGRLPSAFPETPSELVRLLARVRARADRVDELLARATLAKGRATRAREAAQFQANREVMEATKAEVAKRVEFSSAKEREVSARLESFESLRIEHQGRRLVSVTEDAHTVISQIYWQLGAIRGDLRAVIRSLDFESSLER